MSGRHLCHVALLFFCGAEIAPQIAAEAMSRAQCDLMFDVREKRRARKRDG
jgi:hypothetical protein